MEKIAFFSTGQKGVVDGGISDDFLFELIHSDNFFLSFEAAHIIIEKGHTFRIDSWVQFVSDIDVRQLQDVLNPLMKSFKQGDSGVNKNASVFINQGINDQSFDDFMMVGHFVVMVFVSFVEYWDNLLQFLYGVELEMCSVVLLVYFNYLVPVQLRIIFDV